MNVMNACIVKTQGRSVGSAFGWFMEATKFKYWHKLSKRRVGSHLTKSEV